MHTKDVRKKAEGLRRKGYSYAMIAEQLEVPKGTLHWWLRDIPYSPNQYARLKRKQGFANSAASRTNQAQERGQQAREEARHIMASTSDRDFLVAGAGLLLGQTSPSPQGAFLRTPSIEVAQFATRWFRDMAGVTPEHFAPFIQIAPGRTYKEALQHWAAATQIPADQFGAPRFTQTKPTKKNPGGRDHGTFYLAFRGCGERYFKVNLEQRIQGFRDALLGKEAE